MKAVDEQTHCVPTVVTGNLKPNALLKLRAFGLFGRRRDPLWATPDPAALLGQASTRT